MGTEAETRGIVDVTAVVQPSTIDHSSNDGRPSDAVMVEIFVPEREIFDRRQKAGRAHGVQIGVGNLHTPLRIHIALGHIPDDLGVIVSEERVAHAERFENPCRGKDPQRLATYRLQDLRHQGISGVAIEVFVARLEIQVLLAGDDGKDVVIGNQILGVSPAGEAKQFPVIAQAARMPHEVPQSDRHAKIRQAGHV